MSGLRRRANLDAEDAEDGGGDVDCSWDGYWDAMDRCQNKHLRSEAAKEGMPLTQFTPMSPKQLAHAGTITMGTAVAASIAGAVQGYRERDAACRAKANGARAPDETGPKCVVPELPPPVARKPVGLDAFLEGRWALRETALAKKTGTAPELPPAVARKPVGLDAFLESRWALRETALAKKAESPFDIDASIATKATGVSKSQTKPDRVPLPASNTRKKTDRVTGFHMPPPPTFLSDKSSAPATPAEHVVARFNDTKPTRTDPPTNHYPGSGAVAAQQHLSRYVGGYLPTRNCGGPTEPMPSYHPGPDYGPWFWTGSIGWTCSQKPP